MSLVFGGRPLSAKKPREWVQGMASNKQIEVLVRAGYLLEDLKKSFTSESMTRRH
jgi:hypothetical protein